MNIAWLCAAPQQAVAVNPLNSVPEQIGTANKHPTTAPTEQEAPTSGFRAEQYETLQSMISSSISRQVSCMREKSINRPR